MQKLIKLRKNLGIISLICTGFILVIVGTSAMGYFDFNNIPYMDSNYLINTLSNVKTNFCYLRKLLSVALFLIVIVLILCSGIISRPFEIFLSLKAYSNKKINFNFKKIFFYK